jgi:hypothetical protein
MQFFRGKKEKNLNNHISYNHFMGVSEYLNRCVTQALLTISPPRQPLGRAELFVEHQIPFEDGRIANDFYNGYTRIFNEREQRFREIELQYGDWSNFNVVKFLGTTALFAGLGFMDHGSGMPEMAAVGAGVATLDTILNQGRTNTALIMFGSAAGGFIASFGGGWLDMMTRMKIGAAVGGGLTALYEVIKAVRTYRKAPNIPKADAIANANAQYDRNLSNLVAEYSLVHASL